jgi:hypothetical protein
MALTDFQKDVLSVISKNRSPNSHFAGGAALNKEAARLSQDLDIFNDTRQILVASALEDVRSLREHGYLVDLGTPITEETSHAEASISKGDDFTRIDWSCDSIYRFFPACRDEQFGWQLHPFDLATNKILALAGRREPRDYVDIIELDRSKYPIATLAWAAPAKDPGFTPQLILDEIVRNSRFTQHDLDLVSTTEILDPVQLKRQFLQSIAAARDLFESLPFATAGKAFIAPDGEILRVSIENAKDPHVTLHDATPYGAVPDLSKADKDG